MHSLPLFGLGIFFALAGIGLFALTLRKAKQPMAPGAVVKKSDLRALEAQRVETNKIRIAGAACVAAGAVLMVLS